MDARRTSTTARKPNGRRADAYERILSAIIFGDLAPGSAAEEKAIARQFGLGLAGVRDALNRLSYEGMVERQPRIGTRIPDLGLRELQDIFEARVLTEGNCAALAAERAGADDIKAMRDALAGYEDVIRKREFRKLVRMDQLFHRALGLATQNRLLAQQVVQMHNNASRFWYFGIRRLDPKAVRADIAAHLDVVTAIERRDPMRAAHAMRTVLGHFPENVRALMGEVTHVPLPQETAYDGSKAGGRVRKRPQKGAREASRVS